MWIDSQGNLHNVDLEDSERLLTPALAARLRGMSETQLELAEVALREWMNSRSDEIPAAEGAQEALYVNVDPPEELRLKPPGSDEQLPDSLLQQLESAPTRWRFDLALALMLFLEVDLPAERGEFD